MSDFARLDQAALRDQILSSNEFKEFYLNHYLSIFRFIFIRIPKTATTSIVRALESVGLGVAHVVSDIPNLADTFKHSRVVAGHFTYRDIVAHLEGVQPVFLSVLREPIARAVSLYCQAMREESHPCHDEVSSNSLYGALRREGMFYEWTMNAQCRFISGAHLMPDVLERVNEGLFVLCGERGLSRLLALVCQMAGVPNAALRRLNASDSKEKEYVRSQADYDDAVRVIGWLTVEDRKLMEYVGDLYVSDPLRRIIPIRDMP